MTRLSRRPALAGLCVATLLAIATTDAGAQSAIDPNAQIVHLRQTCAEPSGTIDNCFESTGDLVTWLWGGGGSDRALPPSASDRVAVHVGPGDFEPFECDASQQARGWVSVIGSGRDQTRFLRTDNATGPASACAGGIMVENCRGLTFSHLKAEGGTGAFWIGGGDATWSDVDMIGEWKPGNGVCAGSLGWYDHPDGYEDQSEHFFFGCRAIASGNLAFSNIAFDSVSAETWFYGGDILAKPSGDTATNLGVLTNAGAEMHVFGSTIRARVGSATNDFQGGFRGAYINGGSFHMHGGIISVSAADSSVDVDVEGIRAELDGFVHTPDTAFNIQAGGQGSSRRLTALGTSTIRSPFLWPSGPTPPGVDSIHGSDAFVDTDAGSTGGEAHMMVRDTGCAAGGGPWRDMVTGACRP